MRVLPNPVQTASSLFSLQLFAIFVSFSVRCVLAVPLGANSWRFPLLQSVSALVTPNQLSGQEAEQNSIMDEGTVCDQPWSWMVHVNLQTMRHYGQL